MDLTHPGINLTHLFKVQKYQKSSITYVIFYICIIINQIYKEPMPYNSTPYPPTFPLTISTKYHPLNRLQKERGKRETNSETYSQFTRILLRQMVRKKGPKIPFFWRTSRGECASCVRKTFEKKFKCAVRTQRASIWQRCMSDGITTLN